MSRLEKLVRILHSVHFKILISFAFVILSGTVLLKLPVSIKEGAVLTWFDSLFIATSAVCVTGLTPVILADVFTPVGFFFIALLVQIGGLSFATFAAAFLLFLRRKASSTMIVESYGVKTRKWARLVKITMGITFSVEALGTLILFFFYQPYTSTLLESLGQAAFTSVSAFNNAGFDAFGTSMVGFNDHAGILITVASLIVLGGLGFLVYADLIDNRGRKLSIQTKVVVVTTVFLIIAGTLGFFLTGALPDGHTHVHRCISRFNRRRYQDNDILRSCAYIHICHTAEQSCGIQEETVKRFDLQGLCCLHDFHHDSLCIKPCHNGT